MAQRVSMPSRMSPFHSRGNTTACPSPLLSPAIAILPFQAYETVKSRMTDLDRICFINAFKLESPAAGRICSEFTFGNNTTCVRAVFFVGEMRRP